MKFSRDACITCGTKFRNTFTADSKIITNNQGSLLITWFWFCSNECQMQAVEAFIDKRYHRKRTAYNDPELPDDHIEEFVAEWEENCERAWYDAYIKFGNQALGEYQAQKVKEIENEESEFYKILHQAEKEVAQESSARET
jgi:hypothetical protein